MGELKKERDRIVLMLRGLSGPIIYIKAIISSESSTGETLNVYTEVVIKK